MRSLFKNPPREYSTGPLWVWNDMLTEEQIRDTLQDMANQKVKQVWVHPRPGLMTPYLSADWFRLWKVALKEAERLDMNVWIYDENSYPSGFAGGWVPELMPESRGRGLTIREAKTAPKWSQELVGVYRLEGSTSENVTARVKAGETLAEGKYLVASEVRAGNSPWHGNRSYVNLLSPGVTEKFIEVTLEPYRREIGKHFGGRVPGVFTDEPNIRPAGGFPWSEILVQEFKKRWGYDLLEHLPSLAQPIGDCRKIRHDYFQLLHEQFVEHWAKPNHDYCETNRLAWTGHYWDHEWPNCMGVPDNMAMYAWHQVPAIDCLMNQYAENTHAQFGNVRMARELLSVANQLGIKRTLCEIYGAGGWDLRFEDMKRIGDWLQVLGVNTLNQHLSYVTLRGARKRDHPQSFSYQEPWWDAYHVSAEYFARLSTALSQGRQVNRILVLEPTTTAWMYQGDDARLNALGESFFKLLMTLETAQVEYDLGCEDVLARYGSVQPISECPPIMRGQSMAVTRSPIGAELKVGAQSYRTVIIPSMTETLNEKTVKLLESFLKPGNGGEVLCLGEPPARVEGKTSERLSQISKVSGWKRVGAEALPGLAPKPTDVDGVSILRHAGDKGILFHHRRQLEDGQILFLVNTSIEFPSAGTIEAGMRSVEKWDLYTGRTEQYAFEPSGGGLRASFELPPSGSLLLFLSDKAAEAPASKQRIVKTIAPVSGPEISRIQPNVLTLDYVDITAGGETKKDIYFYQANQFAWRKNGMERNPWDSAVQFKDELISKKFPTDSGFEANYKFHIEGTVPQNLAIIIERPDLYTITCNGKPVKSRPGDWWLDKAFGRIDISSDAQPGANVVTIKASPFTMFHELEPAYLLGDFGLKPADHGFIVTADQPLKLGTCNKPLSHGNNPDGSMWLSAGIDIRNAESGKSVEDRAPFVVFDLGRTVNLSAVNIWNYNENHVRDLTSRGVGKLRISGALKNEPNGFKDSLGAIELARAKGSEAVPQLVPISAQGVRYIRFDILSNQNGVTYPVTGEPPDNGFVGLAEVQFIAADGQPVRGVKVDRASSELAAHRRLAQFLVDGSGLTQDREGWNSQGHPFYSAGAKYSERFDLKRPRGKYSLTLPNWYGSVARIAVNGKAAGYIDAPPWQCDVTKWLKTGQNQIDVTVIGTLKNTLGPHHGSPALGSAWPGNFQRGPEAPPPGANYSTVAYGLFEPFVLKQITAE